MSEAERVDQRMEKLAAQGKILNIVFGRMVVDLGAIKGPKVREFDARMGEGFCRLAELVTQGKWGAIRADVYCEIDERLRSVEEDGRRIERVTGVRDLLERVRACGGSSTPAGGHYAEIYGGLARMINPLKGRGVEEVVSGEDSQLFLEDYR